MLALVKRCRLSILYCLADDSEMTEQEIIKVVTRLVIAQQQHDKVSAILATFSFQLAAQWLQHVAVPKIVKRQIPWLLINSEEMPQRIIITNPKSQCPHTIEIPRYKITEQGRKSIAFMEKTKS